MLYRFGDYRVDVAAGRVDRRGEPVALQPRPFALLTYLIRERQRVVPKEELQREIWSDAPVSDSALGRAVMKLRQALAAPDGAEVVRTVMRVGYRFVAPLHEDAGASAAIDTPTETIAVLPVRNATGDAALGWLELGLMALAVRSLEGDDRLAPVAVASVMTALQGAPAAGDRALDAAVRRATGASIVVHSRVERGHGGELRLFYEARGSLAWRGSVVSRRPTELAAGLADALVQALHPTSARPRVQHDPLTEEVFARALQALAVHQWAKAANLLQLALELEPGRIDVQLELLRAMGNLADTGMLEPAQRLLAHAERVQDEMLAARVHQALGRLHLNRSELAQADHHLGLSLERAAGRGGPDWTARTLMLQAGAAADRLEYARAVRIVGRMLEQCRHSGDRILPVAGLIIEANATALGGDLERGAALAIEATRQARELRANSYLIDACDSAVWYLAKLGRLAEAAAHAEEAVAVSLCVDNLAYAWRALPALCWVYGLAGTPQFAQRALTRMPDPAGIPWPEHVWRAHALLAAAAGRHAEAADHLARAVRRQREAGHHYEEEQTLPWLIDALVLSGRLDDAEAEFQRAGAPHLAGSGDLKARLLHCRALLAEARGQVEDAMACLGSLAASAAAPLWRAWACIDLAWLEARAGRPEAAARTLDRVPAVLAGHPQVTAMRAQLRPGTPPAAQRGLPTHQPCHSPSRHE